LQNRFTDDCHGGIFPTNTGATSPVIINNDIPVVT